MKLILDIADNKVDSFMEIIKSYSYVKAQPLSLTDAELFEEINQIKTAFENVKKIKSGKLKGRPAEELLDEL